MDKTIIEVGPAGVNLMVTREGYPMALSDCIRSGVSSAKEDIARLQVEKNTIQQFLHSLAEAFTPDLCAEFCIHVEIGNTDLSVLDDATGERVAWLFFNPGSGPGSDFLFTDFRGIPCYPLPGNTNSYDVALKYFGNSMEWYRAAGTSPDLREGNSSSIRLSRQTLEGLVPPDAVL